MRSTFLKIIRIRPWQWRILLQTQWRLLLVRRQLEHLGLKKMLAALELRVAKDSTASAGADRARSIARWVNISANRGPVRGACLQRSLVLVDILAREGIVAQLKLGANAAAGDFQAHAWVEVDGEPVNDTGDVEERFGAFGPAGRG